MDSLFGLLAPHKSASVDGSQKFLDNGKPELNFSIADYPPGIRSNVLLPKMDYGTPLQGRSS